MAHWAEIDENSIVKRVLVGDNDDPNGDEGYQWLVDNLGGTWVKTSYNSRGGKHLSWGKYTVTDSEGNEVICEGYVDDGKPHLRYNFAGIGYLYDPIKDAFIEPKPDPVTVDGISYDFVLNEQTCLWDMVEINPTE